MTDDLSSPTEAPKLTPTESSIVAPPPAPEVRTSVVQPAVAILPVLAALVASAMLLVDYVRPAPVFCDDAGSGCAAVRGTALAHVFGVPTPVFGLLGLSVVGALFLARGPKARALGFWLTGSGALAAAGLLAVQAGMRKFCVYCCAVDAATLIAFWFAWDRRRHPWDAPEKGPARPVLAGLLALAVLLPTTVGFSRTPALPPVPDVVRRELDAAPNALVIVDFADFECPYCRATHEQLVEALAADAASGAKGQRPVKIVRKQVPLTIHLRARFAARGALCAEAQGKGDAMADALFAAPLDQLFAPGVRGLAEKLGLDLAAYDACVASAATEARIDQDRAAFFATGAKGIPLLFVGPVRLDGAQEAAALTNALARARGM